MIRKNFSRYFLKQCHQVALSVSENKQKLCNNQCFLLKFKTVFAKKLHVTSNKRCFNINCSQSTAIFSDYSIPIENHCNF